MSLSVQLVIISLTLLLANVNFSEAVRSGRYRRSEPMPMTAEQIQTVVDYHNELRAGEGADNMELMTYNETLAELAANWAAQCIFSHPSDELNQMNLGQNIYASQRLNENPDPHQAIQSWFSEKPNFDYDTATCASGKMCGHYTQIVWATTLSVGCAYHGCKPLTGTRYEDVEAAYFVCNYWPGGNYAGAKPYTKGPACTKCVTGAGWCTDGLCNRQCSGLGESCSCGAICYNCATLDPNTCRCSCADGWQGNYCTVPCVDGSSCNPEYPKRGWKPKHCNNEWYQAYVQFVCPAMCDICTADPDAVAGQCPPVNGAEKK